MTALLRAISEKLIPGIPEKTRVAILQQTNASDSNTDVLPEDALPQGKGSGSGRTVIEEVIDKATARNELKQEINGLS